MSRTLLHGRQLRGVLYVALIVGASTARAQDTAAASRRATVPELTGIVRDSLGHPIASVDVTIADGARARTDSTGRFIVGAPAPGAYVVWFRRAGWVSTQFEWAAHADETMEVEVHLRVLPHTLDPVVVRAAEDRAMAAASSVSGTIVDTAGVPVPDVEVQLVGASRVMVSSGDGSFLFPRVLPGDITLRARRLGYAPAVARFRLVEKDQRGITLRIHELPHTLAAVQITEQSGYGSTERAWRELDQRQRFRTNGSVTLGPADLQRFGKAPLDIVARTSGIQAGGEMGRLRVRVTNIRPGAAHSPSTGPKLADEACVLENGTTPRVTPLSRYSASDVESVEYYPAAPPESELTETVYSRMLGVRQCAPDDPSGHPAYWVIWLKGADR